MKSTTAIRLFIPLFLAILSAAFKPTPPPTASMEVPWTRGSRTYPAWDDCAESPLPDPVGCWGELNPDWMTKTDPESFSDRVEADADKSSDPVCLTGIVITTTGGRNGMSTTAAAARMARDVPRSSLTPITTSMASIMTKSYPPFETTFCPKKFNKKGTDLCSNKCMYQYMKPVASGKYNEYVYTKAHWGDSKGLFLPEAVRDNNNNDETGKTNSSTSTGTPTKTLNDGWMSYNDFYARYTDARHIKGGPRPGPATTTATKTVTSRRPTTTHTPECFNSYSCWDICETQKRHKHIFTIVVISVFAAGSGFALLGMAMSLYLQSRRNRAKDRKARDEGKPAKDKSEKRKMWMGKGKGKGKGKERAVEGSVDGVVEAREDVPLDVFVAGNARSARAARVTGSSVYEEDGEESAMRRV
ncbi:uncharacterized protein K452DRAFT_315680 [Aplosporella prunicola CBS 121167]|uniref:Uncharacterized protein n=1 Tax=Aplosporella prunicola CBS 121167 TaxID=1176127 RepID=A0A6A6BPP7_9PEZI|nr:uncharacterized protein K452DRAFT_315680 [Aplosporella prunicola CBS 121167]KAF2145433.1 hypothetical protein K452DRAFT_315680 [Aplosporella prunicola CBS 121167]